MHTTIPRRVTVVTSNITDTADAWLRALTHRKCDPELQPWVLDKCRTHPEVLPRQHQDDRGTKHRDKGYRSLAEEGAYRGIPCWLSRDHWLDVVIPTVIRQRRDIIAAHKISPELLTRWATVKSGYAKSRSGRQCIVRPDTLASVIGCNTRTVQRINRLARVLGLEVVVQQGRMLTLEECLQARGSGSRQRGLSTEVALVNPLSTTEIDSASVNATPTRGKRFIEKTHEQLTHPKDKTKKGGATRRLHRTGVSKPERETLTRTLRESIPWLERATHGGLWAAVAAHAIASPDPWTADDLIWALRHHGPRLTADEVRTRPEALARHVLRKLDAWNDHPRRRDIDEAAGVNQPTKAIATEHVPCGHAHCDGFGFRNWTQNGRNVAMICPDCGHTALRVNYRPSAEPLDPWMQDWHPGDECPF